MSPNTDNAPIAAQRNMSAIMESLRFTSITAANMASTNATGRNTNPPSASNPHTLNEQNFQNATAINSTDTGFNNDRRIRTTELSRHRSSPTSAAVIMKYEGISRAADATTEPTTPFML